MSLDAPKSDAELIALATCACGHLTTVHFRVHGVCLADGCDCDHFHRATAPVPVQRRNGVVLGLDSPLRRTQGDRKARVDREHELQVSVIAWKDDPATLAQWPELAALYAVPNEGSKSKREGGMKKARGRVKGQLDLCLPVARGPYITLDLEAKDEASGRLSDSQRERMALLRSHDHRCEVFMTKEAAIAIIRHYLEGSPS